MKKSILISGGNGKLATEIKKVADSFNVLAPSKNEMDITCLENVEKYINKFKPTYFLHAGAFTKPMHNHQLKPDISIKTNIIGTCNVVLGCLNSNTKLIYISTDYVYPGLEGNYREEDPLLPFSRSNDGISKYGWSKLGGECAVRFLNNYLIIRACLCDYPFPHNVAFSDVKKSYIYSKDAAKIIIKLLEQNGVINLGGEPKTVYEFASKNNKNIKEVKHKEVTDLDIAPDTSINLEKLNEIINH